MLFTLLFYIFVFVLIIQSIYYIFIFGKFSFLPHKKTNLNRDPISVIICARNEAVNLHANLKSILTQKHSDFEVILVNDASTDESLKVLHSFKAQFQNLKIIDIAVTSNYSGNKKAALAKGIAAASNEKLLFTDADCKPASPHWITEMTSQFSKEKDIVLGYGGYKKIKHSFLNKLIRFETLLTAIQYFSYANIGIPYMGVGRNLAYKKEVFMNANGFENHAHITSGDDDLLINQIATKKNTAISIENNSFTISEPKKSFSEWFHQKRRHVTTANYYNYTHQLLLGLFYTSQFLFWFLAIILLFFSFKWLIVTILLIIRLIIQYTILGKAAKKLNENDLTVALPVLDFFMVAVQMGIFISNLISKPKKW